MMIAVRAFLGRVGLGGEERRRVPVGYAFSGLGLDGPQRVMEAGDEVHFKTAARAEGVEGQTSFVRRSGGPKLAHHQMLKHAWTCPVAGSGSH
jgi:hypothetical protein